MSAGDAVSFRDARRDDLPAIVRMLADDPLGAGREAATDPLPPEYGRAFDAIAASSDQRLLVAEHGGAVVGCLQLAVLANLSHRGTARALIEGVRVRADQRGRGVGAAMIGHAIDLARAAGCGAVELSSHASRVDARRFYERLGFVASHVGMKLSLSQPG